MRSGHSASPSVPNSPPPPAPAPAPLAAAPSLAPLVDGGALDRRGTPGFLPPSAAAAGFFLPTSPPVFWKQWKHEQPLGCTPPTITTSPESIGPLPMSPTTRLPRPEPLLVPTLSGLRPSSRSYACSMYTSMALAWKLAPASSGALSSSIIATGKAPQSSGTRPAACSSEASVSEPVGPNMV